MAGECGGVTYSPVTFISVSSCRVLPSIRVIKSYPVSCIPFSFYLSFRKVVRYVQVFLWMGGGVEGNGERVVHPPYPLLSHLFKSLVFLFAVPPPRISSPVCILRYLIFPKSLRSFTWWWLILLLLHFPFRSGVHFCSLTLPPTHYLHPFFIICCLLCHPRSNLLHLCFCLCYFQTFIHYLCI